MGKNIVVYDIETKNSFDDVGGRDHFTELGISVVGFFDYATGEFGICDEAELSKFAERLQKKPLLVGFNSKKFDIPILQKYIPFDLKKLPQLDIMEEFVKILGHRISLDSVAMATLNASKSASGLDAIRFYREGKIDELKKYCLDDVRITRDIYEYVAKNGELFYTSKFGKGKSRVAISWTIDHPDEKETEQIQQSLF